MSQVPSGNQIVLATTAVRDDEPTTSVVEMNLVQPGIVGMHRYQIITVIRGDREEQCWNDLGPAENFTRPQFRIVTGYRDPDTGKLWSGDNVGKAVEMANQLREGPFEQPEPPPNRPDLAQLFRDQPEVRRKGRKKVSTFGHGPAIVRH